MLRESSKLQLSHIFVMKVKPVLIFEWINKLWLRDMTNAM